MKIEDTEKLALTGKPFARKCIPPYLVNEGDLIHLGEDCYGNDTVVVVERVVEKKDCTAIYHVFGVDYFDHDDPDFDYIGYRPTITRRSKRRVKRMLQNYWKLPVDRG